MSEKGTYYCDGPNCESHAGAWDGHRQPPIGFLTVTESGTDPARFLPLHFCGWDCALRYAGQREPETVIPFSDEGSQRDA